MREPTVVLLRPQDQKTSGNKRGANHFSKLLLRPLIEVLGWKTIEQLISIESKTMVFKSLNELAPQYLCGLFTKNSQCSTRRTLRNTGTDVRLPKKNSANGKKCFSFRGAKLWNSLSAESKQASSLNSFKKSI